MKLKQICEGKVKLFVPDVAIPEHGKGIGFYNPAMLVDRNISVCAVYVFAKRFRERYSREPRLCDALSATGVRALRYRIESGVSRVLANDVNERAAELIERNTKLNKADIEIANRDANVLLSERRFDIIDIDPFGSPARFIDATARSLSKFSLLMVTATDTATLYGKYTECCRRRYFANSYPFFERELGVRILISFIIRELAKYNLCFTPVLSYTRRHYLRVFGLVEKGSSKVNEVLSAFKPLYCTQTEWRFSPFGGARYVGEIYLGRLHEKNVCREIRDEMLKRGMEGSEILERVMEEIEQPFYYELPEIASSLKVNLPKISEVIHSLRAMGYSASRTVFSQCAVKSDAGANEVKKALSNPSLSPSTTSERRRA